MKTHHGFERLRLTGLFGARDEFHLVVIVQNLKSMALRLFAPPLEPAGRTCVDSVNMAITQLQRGAAI